MSLRSTLGAEAISNQQENPISQEIASLALGLVKVLIRILEGLGLCTEYS
jgi:hypothetical protein